MFGKYGKGRSRCHPFPDALEQLADRLDAAHAVGRTDPARTEQQHEV